MKKILILLALALPMLAGAQNANKLGYVNTQELFALMPDVKNVQTRLDSLNKQYEDLILGMQEEMKKKYTEYEQKASTMPEAMKKIQEEEIYTMQQRIQTTIQTAQEDLQNKEREFYAPIHEKMTKAIQKVAEKEGYTYVFNAAAMVYVAPAASNLMEPVKKELGIK